MRSREDLLMKKARLMERIALQRMRLSQDVEALQPVFRIADKGAAVVGALKANPGWVALAAGVLVAARPRRALAWGRRGFVIWRTVRWIRNTYSSALSGTIVRT